MVWIISAFLMTNIFNMDKIVIQGTTYMTVNSYAKYKGVTIQTVYNWIKTNKVETKKMLSAVFVRV